MGEDTGSGASSAAKSSRPRPPKSTCVSRWSGLSGITPIWLAWTDTGLRGGAPMMDSRTCSGSGRCSGTAPLGRLRWEPLAAWAVEGRLVVEESGEMSDSEEERGFRPGRKGKGAGRSPGYSLRGAGEAESRRGGGVPAGVGCADRRSRPHMLPTGACLCANRCISSWAWAAAAAAVVMGGRAALCWRRCWCSGCSVGCSCCWLAAAAAT
jgi:hypothetical protein